ncbi:trans-sialidase [Trypanosoma cruzi Dm28c]|uniref:Trans-sialidase n=2 Tax=Trypanosoma cruzi TaxID=5693 RepID=V5A5D2_TRYCR|nr:trans-sialidase [Trypanosoma cruzi Dm28c]PBJ77904.1 trans-sialidase [Trypanosoma cruzi cruzi]PWU93108.1 putative trans-sialidase, Group VI [Trypanosoma cruzi]
MLSRVAAVKAPRTHNRRRMTGSSGRRREGRESEPQRPNMSRRVITSAVLLLVVVMMCCGAGVAVEIAGQSTVSKFEWKDVKDEGVTVESLGVPGLLNVGSDVFAVAEAQCKKNSESITFTGIASQIITIEKDKEPKEEVLKNAKEKTQVLEESISGKEKKKVDVSRPTAIVEGSNIYMLVGKHSHETADNCQANSEKIKSGMLLVKGEVVKGGNKEIRWNETGVLPCTLGAKHDSFSQLIFGGGSGVKLRDATFLFPVEATKKKDEKDVKTASLIIHNAASWKLSKEVSADGCGVPSVVEWKDDKLMMMTACDDGCRRVYEIGDKGNSWTEALGTLSRVWGNPKGEGAKGVRSGFITATIDNRNVMLVTLPVYAKETEKKNAEKGVLHLWMTDNTHIVYIGPVSDDDVAASSLLYKSAGSGDKEELIVLYEKKKKGDEKPSPGMVSVRLTAQLQRVKDVLQTWKEADDRVSKLCPSENAGELLSTGSARRDFKITDGLVGFLSGNFSENTWRDEYLGVNATVKKEDAGETEAALHEGSVKFTGRGAEWPVGSQGENQLYHFANYNFTLVATVSIDKVQEEFTSISLMGAKMNDDGNPVLFGLSYNKEKKWQLLCGGENSEDHSSNLATETTHHVVILLRNGTQGSAYVDGQRVGRDEACDLKNTEDKKISHFYIGGDGNSAGGVSEVQDVSVTVTNVLLYNRPLDDDEINALNTKLSIPKAKDAKTVKVTQPVVTEPATLETEIPSSHVGQQQTEQGSLKKSKDEGSVGVSTSAVSSVTNSPASKESEDQSALGTFPEGNPNVDVDSSSEGVQTVDAETGDMVQGDGTQQPSAGTPATADTNAPTAEIMAHDGAAVTPEVSVSSGGNGETVVGTDGQGELHPQDGEVKAAALSSSLGNVSQGNNSDGGTVSESRMVPLLLLLLLGLWGLAAL